MKFLHLINLTLGSLVCLTTNSFGEIVAAPTAESLAKQKAAYSQRSGSQFVEKTDREVLVKKLSQNSVLAESRFLIGALGYTIVPEGSVYALNTPFQIVEKKPNEIAYLPWKEFLRKHYANLSIVHLQKAHLMPGAETTLIKEKIQAAESLKKTCVTLFQGYPARMTADKPQQ